MQNNHANDDNNVIKSYLKELSKDKFKPIPYPIEKSLVENAKQGDKKSEKQLIEAHLRLVCNIAKRYKGLTVEYSDLVQEGNLGLYEALKRFDSKKNIRFCVYAEWWVKNYICKLLTDKTSLRNNEVSLNSLLIGDDKKDNDREEDSLYYDSIKENNVDFEYKEEDNTESQQNAVVSRLLDGLDERMRYVIELCYGLNGKERKTMVDIGKELDLTPERVRQIKERAMMTLRSNALAQNLSMHNIYE